MCNLISPTKPDVFHNVETVQLGNFALGSCIDWLDIGEDIFDFEVNFGGEKVV